MRQRVPTLMCLLESFFRDYLQQVRGVSPHTSRAYRDALRLYFAFVCQQSKCSVERVNLDHLTCERVIEFLAHLDAKRANAPQTRNARLSAIRCFVRHVLRYDPTRAGQYSQILAIPAKRTRQRTMAYLEPEQIQLLLKSIPLTGPSSIRDAAFLLFLYNTGARISEALQLRWSELRLDRPWQVRLHGKGGRDRVCPLWKQTVLLLRQLCKLGDQRGDESVFRNAKGQCLSRDGAAYVLRRRYRGARENNPHLPDIRVHPHVLRHSCAVALLQAGVDLTGIRDYLGHSSISTTSRYLQTDLAAKEKTLRRFWDRAGISDKPRDSWRPGHGILEFLRSL